jgi:hypothetical protein
MRTYSGRYKHIPGTGNAGAQIYLFIFIITADPDPKHCSTYDKKKLDLLLKKVALSWPESSWNSRLLSRALSSRNSAAPPRSFPSFS